MDFDSSKVQSMKISGDHDMDFHETRESFDPGKHGKDYEIEMSKFIFKRLLDMNYKNFKFTREKKGLGKFDDLVFIYEDSDGLWYSLVQLKHIMDETRNIDYESLADQPQSYFFLPKYFVYYQKSLDSINLDSNFEKAALKHLIICTNIDFDENLGDIKKIKINEYGIFNQSGCLYKLSVSQNIKRKIFSECYVSDREKLAKELCLHILLNKPIDINNLIKNENANIISKFHVLLNLEVIDIHNNCFKTEFLMPDLDEKSYAYSFRKSILSFIEETYLKCKMAEESYVKNTFRLSYRKATNLKFLVNKYNEKDPLEFLRNVKFTIMKGFGEQSLTENSKCSFSDLKEVDFHSIDESIEHFLNKLVFAVGQNKNEFIVRQELQPNLFIAYSDKINDWYYNVSFKNKSKMARKREWISKDKIVSEAMNYIINFQNKNICLSEIIDDKSLLNSNILIMVFSSFPISIANTCENVSEMSVYYILRHLKRQRCIQKAFLKERNTDIIFLSDPHKRLSKKDIYQLIPDEEVLFSLSNINSESNFIQVDEYFNTEKFDNIVDKYQKEYEWENVHWLEIDDDNIFWKKTYGSLNALQNYIMEKHEFEDNINEVELLQITGPIVISGEPGMGKSTLLHNVKENIMRRRSGPTLAIKILLKNTLNFLDNVKNIKDFDAIFNFVAECANVTDNVNDFLLKQCILTKKVALIFDGFDELRANKQMVNFITIVKCIKSKFNKEQIWITTRPHRKTFLEDNLGVISFSLKEITSEEQVTYLTKFWEHHTEKPSSYIDHFSKTLISSLNNRFTFHEKDFLGIPLQTYMFATVFMEELKKDSPNINKDLYLTNLFSSFIHSKYDLFFKKFGVTSLPGDFKQVLINVLDEVHQNFSLCQGGIFPSAYVHKLNKKHYNIEDERLLEVGIVYKSNKCFQFIHKTFAEYLIAKRMANFVLNNEKEIFIEEILFELITVKENKFLLYLFDNEIAENFPQLKYVLQGQLEKVEQMLDEDFHTSDCLGRNHFYYAFQYRHFDIIDILFKKNCSMNSDDTHLLKAIEAYFNYCYTNNINNKKIIDKIFLNVIDSDSNFALKIIDFIDMKIEIMRKNWEIVEKILTIRKQFQKFNNNTSILENALKFNSPLHIIINIFSCIKMNKDILESEIVGYSNFIKYLFLCSYESIEMLMQTYCTSFIVKPPLYIRVYEYFDLRHVDFGNSISSLVYLMEERSVRYYKIVKLLLENGVFYVMLRNDNINDIFGESRMNSRLLKLPIFQFVENTCKIDHEYLNKPFSEITQLEKQLLPQNVVQVLEIFDEYKNTTKLDKSDTIQDVVARICINILRNTDAIYLIYLANMFHKAVVKNEYKDVKKYLKEAKLKGWQKALLKSTGENSLIPEEVAKKRFHVRIYALIRRKRLSLLS
ncbi:UNVERIFIED_CONTAM: hypothetical protein RMT77_009849 [Armadillidium vulgare]